MVEKKQSLFSPSLILAERDRGSNPSFATYVKNMGKIISQPLHGDYNP